VGRVANDHLGRVDRSHSRIVPGPGRAACDGATAAYSYTLPVPIAASTKLGPYELVSPLGAGGMGEVWKARDHRLDRNVAIKILPESLAKNPDLLARFEREAKSVAALSHPNILALHDIGRHDDVSYAVMELLEGESLRARLAEGPLPARKAVELGVQIANGLAAAHERGVVHRDLKPDNLWVTKDGRAKILDFGLAKQTQRADAAGSDLPTQGGTDRGTVLGTVGYMSPEQVRGEAVDHRSDIFSLGVVLHEMLTGKRAFARASATETMAAILRDEPAELESTAERPIPGGLARIVAHCLEKNADHRFRSAHDVAFALENVSASAPSAAPFTAPYAPQVQPTPWKGAALVAVGLLGAAAAGYLAGGWSVPAATPDPILRLALPLPEGDRYVDTNRRPFAISPDGSTVVYVAVRDGRRLLHVRRLGEREPVLLAGTEGAGTPFFSPDGQWVGFMANRMLKKVAIGGSGLETLVRDLGDSRGGHWGADGTILYTPNNMSGIFRVPSSGGTPVQVTRLDAAAGEISHRWPHALPDGSILFNVWHGPGTDEHAIVVQSPTGARQVLVAGGDMPTWVPPGRLLYGRFDRLYVVPWKPGSPPPSGAARELPEHPRIENEGSADYVVSEAGTMAYMAGSPKRYALRLVWVDRAGTVTPLPLPERNYLSAVLSPDGSKAIVQIEEGTIGLHLYDFGRGTLAPLATTGGSSQAPVFSPDGRWVVYRATRKGTRDLWRKLADGSGEEAPFVAMPGQILSAMSVSADGLVAYSSGQNELWVASLEGDPAPRRIVASPADEQAMSGQFSPDGRTFAYTRVVAGIGQIVVQPFPGPGAVRQVGVGMEPRWSKDGRELFFDRDGRMWVVARTSDSDEFGPPRELLTGRFRPASNANSAWDVAPDGRFLRIQQVEPEERLAQIDVVLGFDREVEAVLGAR
jgi:Tol biopolymer transport system component